MHESIRLRDVRMDRIGDDTHIRGRLPQAWRLLAGFEAE